MIDLSKSDFNPHCYERLDIEYAASLDEIKNAYRKKASAVHPDTNPNDPNATLKFQEVKRAFEILKDVRMRERYDRLLLLHSNKKYDFQKNTERPPSPKFLSKEWRKEFSYHFSIELKSYKNHFKQKMINLNYEFKKVLNGTPKQPNHDSSSQPKSENKDNNLEI